MKFITYGNYVYVPIIATAAWFATLLGLLLYWTVADHHVQYRDDEATIVYISDAGAVHKTLFISGCALTLAFFAGSLWLERVLRHFDRIPGTVRRREPIMDGLAVFFGCAGGLALLFLSIFDAFNHSRVHWTLTVVFIVCIALCALFQTLEIFFLKNDHPDVMHLRRNAIIKCIIVTAAIVLAVAFGICYGICKGGEPGQSARCNTVTSAAAVLEWTIAFLFDLFLATFILDLWPAAKTSPRHLRRHERHEREAREKGLLRTGNSSPNGSLTMTERPSTDPYGNSRLAPPVSTAV